MIGPYTFKHKTRYGMSLNHNTNGAKTTTHQHQKTNTEQ